jgi:integrase
MLPNLLWGYFGGIFGSDFKGPIPPMALKEMEARNAAPKEKAYKLADGEGLYLLVQPNGSKLWRMKYRFAGKEKVLSFGAYPAVSAACARQGRLKAKHTLSLGKDPMAGLIDPAASTDLTFEMVARRWHDNRKDSLDAAHATRVWSRLERDILPALGNLEINAIAAPEVLSMVRRIEARGALDISRRAKQTVGQVYQFAIACGWASSDPSTHLRGALKPRPRVKHMSRLPFRDFPEFLVKLDSYVEENARRSLITRHAVSFALLTWVRSKELRFARCSEFEGLGTTNALWRIPGDRMKMKRDHVVPLSRQAQALVEELMSDGTGHYLFPGIKPLSSLSENTMIYALYRMGYIGRQTIHGFRSLASTWANEQLIEFGEPSVWVRKYHEDWVEMQLAHSEENEVRGAYNAAEYLAPRRRMMQEWADYVDEQRNTGKAAVEASTRIRSTPQLKLVS